MPPQPAAPPTSPRIAFATSCKGRTQHLELTLPRNLSDNADYANLVFVILNYNSPDHLMAYLRHSHRKALESGRVVVYSYPSTTPFRMAHAKNMAHRLGILEGADILVNLDADNFTGPRFASYVARRFDEQEEEIFLWTRVVPLDPSLARLSRGASGRIVCSTNAFLLSNGYDEKYETWGPDDKDYNTRLRNLGYSAYEIDHRYIDVVLHNDRMRFKEYPEARTTAAGEDETELVRLSGLTIANYGHCGEGVVYRNLNPTPITLSPIPTRIFGVGMHKTGTTSLHTALTLLGFDSAHWTSAHWAKAIYREMTTLGRSVTLERNYAISDLPMPLLYKQLDTAYPGSKFILTTRHEVHWLNSIHKHWDPAYNQYRGQWNSDPFTHKVHRLLYGQKGFDAELFLARFRAHNRGVMEYFKDRPGDLLVMDGEENAGWLELCGFLGRPIPSMPYPRVLRTKLD
jgi:Sulfotransferase domain/N-terminal domain of galactosyltransferase